MQDIIDALRANNQATAFPLALPDDDDLLDVEESILLPLPRDYKHFLLTVSDVIVGKLEPATAADPSSHTYLVELTSQAWDEGLPRDLIPVCYHEGAYYCIDQEGRIGCWQQGSFSDSEWDSIWQWARDVWLGEP